MSDLWHDAADDMNKLDDETLTWEKRAKVAELKALLAIGQELSRIHNEGINPEYNPPVR